ncbi:MAG: CDP-alcohol phosphatidyltransferase family protein [Chloroflexota bacterium]
MNRNRQIDAQKNKKLYAWGVHLFTASGAVWGLLSIIAIMEERWQAAFIWLLVAVVVDSVDGVFARYFQVKGMLPGFDGGLLDNIIDYQTYVVAPAILLYKAELLPPVFAILAPSLLVLASAYQFAQADAKTDDHFFTGFPSYWNIAVFYLFMLGLTPWANLVAIMLCIVMIFVPIKYIYPSRTTRFQRTTIILGIVWGGMLIVTLAQYPTIQQGLIWGSLLYVAYYVGISVYLTNEQKRLQKFS